VDELSLFLGRALEESALRRESATLRRALKEQFSFSTIIGRTGAMREVCDLAERLATAATTLLITGETGTGKGLFARALHGAGSRANAPFVMLNCAAVPEALLESELFGHVRGAFTGAVATRRGLFAEASGGTLFLDEVGELPLGTQAKLLHVLERRMTRAVGSDREVPVDVRIVAATNRNLRERVAAGAFREDLLFRLNVVELEIPPLRHRGADLPTLIAHFLARARARTPSSPVMRFSAAALARLFAYPWPGNVRELENTIERVVLLGGAPEVGVADLPESVRVGTAAPANRFDGPVQPLQVVERDYARWALEQLGGRKLATAERLEIDRKTLNRLLDSGGGERPAKPVEPDPDR
jgi:DNA-binding NtrC family response regulator